MTPAVARALDEASEEARVLAAKAAEAVEKRAHAASRSYRLARRRAEDAADEAATCIRKQPLKAVGAALGAGLVIGVAGGLLAAVIGRRWVGRNHTTARRGRARRWRS
jgi:ElaB/YqjD/DUF883 family membrane-anchored ribosome-binding protein